MRILIACSLAVAVLFATTSSYAQRAPRVAPRTSSGSSEWTSSTPARLPRPAFVDKARNMIPKPFRKVATAAAMPIYFGIVGGTMGAWAVGTIGAVVGGPISRLTGALTGGTVGTVFGVKLGAEIGLGMLTGKKP
jgi:hypothetical protein